MRETVWWPWSFSFRINMRLIFSPFLPLFLEGLWLTWISLLTCFSIHIVSICQWLVSVHVFETERRISFRCWINGLNWQVDAARQNSLKPNACHRCHVKIFVHPAKEGSGYPHAVAGPISTSSCRLKHPSPRRHSASPDNVGVERMVCQQARILPTADVWEDNSVRRETIPPTSCQVWYLLTAFALESRRNILGFISKSKIVNGQYQRLFLKPSYVWSALLHKATG